MDSTRPLPARAAPDEALAVRPLAAEATPAAPRSALARLGRARPAAATLVRFSYRTAVGSALAVAAIVAAVADGVPGATPGALTVLGAVLLVPALAAALVGWTLGDLARLPGEVRAAAADAVGDLRGARRPRGLGSVLAAVWAARGVVLASRDGWGRAFLAVRLLRLASLPLVLTAAGLFALNAVVIAAGAAAVVSLLLP